MTFAEVYLKRAGSGLVAGTPPTVRLCHVAKQSYKTPAKGGQLQSSSQHLSRNPCHSRGRKESQEKAPTILPLPLLPTKASAVEAPWFLHPQVASTAPTRRPDLELPDHSTQARPMAGDLGPRPRPTFLARSWRAGPLPPMTLLRSASCGKASFAFVTGVSRECPQVSQRALQGKAACSPGALQKPLCYRPQLYPGT